MGEMLRVAIVDDLKTDAQIILDYLEHLWDGAGAWQHQKH